MRSLLRTHFVPLASIAALALFLAPAARAEPRPAAVERLAFKTDAGKAIAWKDIAGSKATVVVFLSFDCPMSNGYSRPLSELAKSLESRGVKFVGLCPCDETPAEVAKKSRDFQLAFPIFK